MAAIERSEWIRMLTSRFFIGDVFLSRTDTYIYIIVIGSFKKTGTYNICTGFYAKTDIYNICTSFLLEPAPII